MSTRRAVTHAHAQPAGAGGPSGDSQLGGRRGRQGCPCPATRAPWAWAPAAHWPQVAPVLASPSRVPSCGGPAPGIPSPRATCAHAPCSGGPGLTVSADPGAPGEGPQGTRGFLPVPAKPCGRECLVLGVCRADRGLQPTAVSSRGAETPHTGPVGQRRTAGRAKPRGTVPVRLHAVTGRTEPGAARPGSLASGAPWWRLPLAPQPSRAATSRPGADAGSARGSLAALSPRRRRRSSGLWGTSLCHLCVWNKVSRLCFARSSSK